MTWDGDGRSSTVQFRPPLTVPNSTWLDPWQKPEGDCPCFVAGRGEDLALASVAAAGGPQPGRQRRRCQGAHMAYRDREGGRLVGSVEAGRSSILQTSGGAKSWLQLQKFGVAKMAFELLKFFANFAGMKSRRDMTKRKDIIHIEKKIYLNLLLLNLAHWF